MLTTEQRQAGITRLLSALHDVERWDAVDEPKNRAINGTKGHADLFSKYRRDIKKATADARVEWEREIKLALRMVKGKNKEKAEQRAWATYPAGPASAPAFVAVVRRYWLACDEINRKSKASDRVLPEVFLLQWLVNSGAQDEVDVLAGMPYWPLGLDEKGNWL